MAKLVCTERLRDVGPCSATFVAGDTVKQVLDNAAADYPRLSNYVLDDHGKVRKHVAIFVAGTLQDPATVLNTRVEQETEIFLLQALSGG